MSKKIVDQSIGNTAFQKYLQYNSIAGLKNALQLFHKLFYLNSQCQKCIRGNENDKR